MAGQMSAPRAEHNHGPATEQQTFSKPADRATVGSGDAFPSHMETDISTGSSAVSHVIVHLFRHRTGTVMLEPDADLQEVTGLRQLLA